MTEWLGRYTADMTRSEAAWAVKEHLEALREKLEDAEAESSSCSDRDCRCHEQPARIRELIEEIEGEQPEPECSVCGHVGTVAIGGEREITICGNCGEDQ